VLWVFDSLALVLLMSTNTELHLIDARLLQPAQAPLVCLALVALDACTRSAPRGKLLAMGLVAAFVIAHAQRTVEGVREHLAQGPIGYRSALWRDSEVLTALARLQPELPLFTNSTPAVYVTLRRRCHRITPGAEFDDALAELEQSAPALLVCIDIESENREYPSPLAELEASQRIELELLSRHADGTLWRVTRRP